jgi:hypothetical protein
MTVARESPTTDISELKQLATNKDALSLGTLVTIMTAFTTELRKVGDQFPNFFSEDDETNFADIRKVGLMAAGVVAIYDVLHVQQGNDKQEAAKLVYDKVVGSKVHVPSVFFSDLRNIAFGTEAEPTTNG